MDGFEIFGLTLLATIYILPLLCVWIITIVAKIKEPIDMEMWIIVLLFFLALLPIVNIFTLIVLLYLLKNDDLRKKSKLCLTINLDEI